jgi:hypothetical protein
MKKTLKHYMGEELQTGLLVVQLVNKDRPDSAFARVTMTLSDYKRLERYWKNLDPEELPRIVLLGEEYAEDGASTIVLEAARKALESGDLEISEP